MLKGTVALIIRYALYALGAAMAGAGIAFYGSDGMLCVDTAATAKVAAEAVGLMLGGGAVFTGSAIWSRVAKRLGGVT